ncbi:MAG: valine--tRNA ligase [Chloroflexi bacterium]|nr:valine--tRNA ligase [Chloroflexota bacterium]
MKSIEFGDLPKRFDIAEREAFWRDRWSALGVEKRDPEAPREKTYVIDSPPPTVSGSLHIGHIFSYTHQDILARYKRMAGWNVAYPMGWDDNGLPTERRVQNYFGVRAEPNVPYIENLDVEIERERAGLKKDQSLVISRQNFIEMCHVVTEMDETVFKDTFNRMGYSIDWSDEYATIDDKSRRIAQRSFLDLYEKGHVYQIEAPTMWDVDFQTAVAQAEVEDRDKGGAYHDIEFGVFEADAPIESFVISTTRPELLAACVGITAHPDDTRFKGLFGKHAVTPGFMVKVPIFPSTEADPEKGTGILMVCTFGDQTDVTWWREQNLELRQILGRNGRILDRTFGSDDGWASEDPERANANYRQIVGKRPPAAKSIMVDLLRDLENSATGNGAPLRDEPRPIQHPVRYYEKGDSPLEYLTTRQWFVRLLDKTDQMLEMGRKMTWHPEFMRKRFENWTENLNVDWCISRQRYFGVPIPVWYPLDDQGEPQYDGAIVATAEMLPVDPESATPPGYSPDQRGIPGGFVGEPDIFDTWFTSSLSPQTVARWGEVDDQMKSMFPMDVRPQGHDIIRTWAFYTIAKAMLHQESVPWHNVMLSGWVLDPDRKKMSKSKGNTVTPVETLDAYGADAVRYWSGSFRLGSDAAHDEAIFKIGGKLVTKIYNAGKFVLSQTAEDGPIVNELDRAFIAELKELVRRVTRAFENYEFSVALQETEKFFWGAFTDNYIELLKRRSRSEDDIAGRASAVAALRLGLNVMLRLFAPFVPTITDEAWSWVFAGETGNQSIHLASWPTVLELDAVAPPANAGSFQAASDAISAVRKAKSESGVSLNRELLRLELESDEQGENELRLVVDDVAAAGGANTIVFTRGTPSADWRYTAKIEPAEVEAKA